MLIIPLFLIITILGIYSSIRKYIIHIFRAPSHVLVYFLDIAIDHGSIVSLSTLTACRWVLCVLNPPTGTPTRVCGPFNNIPWGSNNPSEIGGLFTSIVFVSLNSNGTKDAPSKIFHQIDLIGNSLLTRSPFSTF